MSREGQAEQQWSDYRGRLMDAWVQTRMELDRSLLTVSVAGVGLLVTLLTTTGVSSGLHLAMYAVATVGFVGAVASAITVFRMQARYLEEAASDPSADRSSALERLDQWLITCFAVGVAFSIATGAIAAHSLHLEQGRTANERQEAEHEAEGLTRSGAEELERNHRIQADAGAPLVG